jgi:hypothetical protein
MKHIEADTALLAATFEAHAMGFPVVAVAPPSVCVRFRINLRNLSANSGRFSSLQPRM